MKTVLITGANTGIGYETALELAKKDFKVSLACRNLDKANEAKNKILKECPSAILEIEKLDLADFESIKELGNKLVSKAETIDVLINNAGVMGAPKSETKQGFEMHFGINHLGPFLLTKYLFPLIDKSEYPGRIINLSSSAHSAGRLNFDDINNDKKYSWWKAYGQSKLANILFTNEMVKRLPKESKVTVNSVHPGVVATELARDILPEGSWSRFLVGPIFRPFLKTPAQGAETSIYLASSEDVKGVTGKYFADSKEKKPKNHAFDEEAAKKLWEVSEELVKEKFTF